MLATEDYDYRYSFLDQKNRNASDYNDKNKVLVKLYSSIRNYDSSYSGLSEDERNTIVADAKKNIEISIEGAPQTIFGVRRYIYEIIYNLCDNAIRYNVDGGKVEIKISKDNGHAVVAVKDTGIGIAPEHQSRIFERCYRVDKSHSKETGGTGLGLSIV